MKRERRRGERQRLQNEMGGGQEKPSVYLFGSGEEGKKVDCLGSQTLETSGTPQDLLRGTTS